jgi:MFS superfamily sulfate permease-like transporter
MLLQVGVESMSKDSSDTLTKLELMNSGSKQDRLFVNSIQSRHAPRIFILDFNQCDEIDIAAAHVLLKIIHSLHKQKCMVLFTSLRPALRTLLDKSGVSEALGESHYFESVEDGALANRDVTII